MGKFEVVDTPPETQKKGRFEVVDTPNQPSLMQSIKQDLEPEPGEGPISRGFKGSWRGLLGIAETPLSMANASFGEPTNKTESVLSKTFGPNSLLIKRMVVDPSINSFSQAKESFQSGHPIRGAIHAVAGAAPVVGPYVDSLISRGESGDISGAVTEGLTGLAAGKFLSKVGPKVMGLRNIEPETALNQAIMGGRRYKNTQARQSIRTAIPTLKTAEETMGNPIKSGPMNESIDNFLNVLNQAKRDIWAQYQQKIDSVGTPQAIFTPKRKALPAGPIEMGPGEGGSPQTFLSEPKIETTFSSESAPIPRGKEAYSGENKVSLAQELEDAKNRQLSDVIGKRDAPYAKANRQSALNPPSWQDAFDVSYPNAIDGNAIANAAYKSINPLTQQTKPGTARALIAENDTFRRPYTIDEAERLLQNMNQELMTYYRKNRIDRRGAEGNPSIAAKAARADAMRDALYSKLDQLTGPGSAELKQTYGALLNIEREALSRAAQSSAQPPMNLPQQMGTMYGISRMFTHPIEGVADILLAKKLKQMNSSNYLLQKAFENMDRKPSNMLNKAHVTLPLLQAISKDKENR
jgi:hypothetical protein